MSFDLEAALAANPDLARLNPGLASASPRPNKYHAKRTEYKGRKYDSRHEAEAAFMLELEEADGKVVAWFPQVTIRLTKTVTWRPDFLVLYPSGRWAARDAKGVKTEAYKLRARLFQERFGMAVEEV